MKMILRLIYPVMVLFLLGACTAVAVEPESNGPQALPDTPAELVLEMPIASESQPDQEITDDLQTIWVSPDQQDCEGVDPQQCVQVKWEQDADWDVFSGQITGYTFEPGYEYELVVEKRRGETSAPNTVSNTATVKWRVVEITRTRQVGGSQGGVVSISSKDIPGQDIPGKDASGFGSIQWVLVDFGQPLLDTTQIVMTFNFDEMQVSGSSGCNNFSGGFTFDEFQIGFGPMGMTMMACEQNIMDQESFFLNLLAQTNAYEILGDQLTLSTPDGQTLVFVQMAIE